MDPGSLSPSQVYDLLVGAIQPRPIAFVSTISADGILNLAPFSFFTAGGTQPPSLIISITRSSRGEKDSLANIQESGQFVVNTVLRAMAEGMNVTSANFERSDSEWPFSGLTPLPSLKVAPPRVAESPIQMECVLKEVVRHGEDAGSARYVIGEVVEFHVDRRFFIQGSAQLDDLGLISRLGGPNYLDSATGERFHMDRPTTPGGP